MTENRRRLNPFFSLKTQLCTGAIALLALTLASVSYLLIEHQKRILVGELQKTIVLQGRNIALSSRKALLRSDPEYELFPILKRISSRNDVVEYVVITDAENVIQADLELQNVSKPLELDLSAYAAVVTSMIEDEEKLLGNDDSFLLKTPITGLGKTIGFVYMRYSKQELLDSMSRAVTITVICAVATFALGIVLSLLLFRRISHPMDIMIRGVNAFGRGEFDTRINLPNNNEFRLLATSFNEMASSLSSAQKELVAKKIMDRELEIAHDIQRTLIPANIKQPDGYEIATYYKAAMQVGGDYVDAIPIDSTRIAFVMADVSGKGIPGLVVMAMLKIMAHDLIKKGLSPSNVIRRLNESLAANIRRHMFVTMFLAVLDTESGDLTFSNAGHNPVVIYDNTKKRCELRRVRGRPLGLFDDDVFVERLEEVQHTLKVGDLMLLYTDGLTESQDDKSEQFGVKRVIWLCESFADAGARTLVEELVRAEHSFRGDGPQTDDLTLLAVRSVGPQFGREERSFEEVTELCLSS